jgi:hypothetical protein
MSNEIKEDFLEVDAKIPGQNYVCLSFVSPEKFLKQKEVFFMAKFMENFFNSEDQATVETREKMLNKEYKFTYNNIETLYKDWKYGKNQDLEAEFYEMCDFATTMRTLKVRGVYDTHKEASIRAQVLRKKDPSFNVYVAQVGYWLPWDPEADEVQDQEYQEGTLNELVKKYNENLSNRDDMFEQDKRERIERARREVQAKKEAAKNADANTADKLTTDVEDKKNIDELRSIVDEADKAFYANKKASEASSTGGNTTDNNTNFQSETVSALSGPDPWMERKKNNTV